MLVLVLNHPLHQFSASTSIVLHYTSRSNTHGRWGGERLDKLLVSVAF